MALDLGGLKKAVVSLDSAVDIARAKLAEGVPARELEVIKAGVIRNFEFTYELCWKTMKRWLEFHVGPDCVDGVPRQELFRVAAENLLLTDVAQWMTYHRARNHTSHVYDAAVADEVFAAAMRFLPAARDCLQRVEQRNA